MCEASLATDLILSRASRFHFVFTNLGGLEVTAGTPYKLINNGGINPGDSLDPAYLAGTLPGGLSGALQITGGDLELVVTPNAAPSASLSDMSGNFGVMLDASFGDETNPTVAGFTH